MKNEKNRKGQTWGSKKAAAIAGLALTVMVGVGAAATGGNAGAGQRGTTSVSTGGPVVSQASAGWGG